MISKLSPQITINQTIADFLSSLQDTLFSGDIKGDFANRLIASTDNSIYQILPQAVIFPRSMQDVIEIFKLANESQFDSITFSPRGGGTGTNGQSLSPSIIIDCSKYMNQVLEINLEEEWVRVQPGIILDQLNQILAPHGLFFAPSLAPSNRATIGGMINTDAAGKGSRIYGRTSDHILALTWVLSDGTFGTSSQVNSQNLEALKQQSGRLGNIYKQVDKIVTEKANLITEIFPKLTRFMTGYNLAKVYDEQRNYFDINRILSGSEGTLSVITEAKLKLTKIPKATQLLVIHYQSFDDALADADRLLQFNPSAIETIDETILELAKKDSIFQEVKDFIGEAKAINLVEFIGENQENINKQNCQSIKQLNKPGIISYYLTDKSIEIKQLWMLRKKGAALLGSMPGDRKPIPFIEDTAVPPSSLANYTREFKALLNSYNLNYAMFGHVDVGCLHVRPALDMKSPDDEKLIREISDKVVNLVRKYGGVMWGEHGKGFRSEYTALFFGEELYQDLRKIKSVFDPKNKLNPGKIVTPYESSDEIVKIESTLRGQFDRQVSHQLRTDYEAAFNCNGNGACFNFNPDEIICPSAKQTRERIHSPKGRAMLLREWLRLLSKSEPVETFNERFLLPKKVWHTIEKWRGIEDYSHDVYDAMEGCLACKACVSECPIHVDIPSLKSQFLNRYHSRYLRPLRDYLMANIETLAYYQSFAPNLVNYLLQNPLILWLIKQSLGMVNPPLISVKTVRQELFPKKAPQFSLQTLQNLSIDEQKNTVILIQDALTSFYESDLVIDTYEFLQKLGYNVYIVPFFMNGKPLHLKGFIAQFESIVNQNIENLKYLTELNIPIIGIEPSMTITYRDEAEKIAETKNILNQVQLIQEFIINQDKPLPKINTSNPYYLLGHCHEKSLAFNSQKQWQTIFKNMGINLNLVSVGCCGMAGMYGHEVEHYENSQAIYKSSWQQHLPLNIEDRPYYLATGYSCRSQVQRFSEWTPNHPLQTLNQLIKTIGK
ncbi:FAD-binding and (Fe-S)-binding domain-containing protein [Crocosphaera sp. XPORK-15E]|uniref:D-2-hydroxyglutarate dehydrogenase YdiJ n=1 Tax=Crocosphaera sp. XPORK-15E TaxID=3110247 RepID=UPI002B1EAB83|nr:FAD-binding and (Fe-S)-binding domain-containing protein [Crocosphaera sp. XPORK-15E]MEA5535779.1 FAD-binding and (Fe-S)-binding domain-containing protein [Crocosphaera sp. XPORK-15E]